MPTPAASVMYVSHRPLLPTGPFPERQIPQRRYAPLFLSWQFRGRGELRRARPQKERGTATAREARPCQIGNLGECRASITSACMRCAVSPSHPPVPELPPRQLLSSFSLFFSRIKGRGEGASQQPYLPRVLCADTGVQSHTALRPVRSAGRLLGQLLKHIHHGA